MEKASCTCKACERAGLLATKSGDWKIAHFNKVTNRDAMLSFDETADGKQCVFDRRRENTDIALVDLPEQHK